jgi:flagellar protein FlbT
VTLEARAAPFPRLLWSLAHPTELANFETKGAIVALKVELKPGERVIIGNALITNDDQRTRLSIEGDEPILRERDILHAREADTPCKKIYVAVQLMYLAGDPAKYKDLYLELVRDVIEAAPSTRPYIEVINNQILTGSLYKALKQAKNLVSYEEGPLHHARQGSGVRRDRTGDAQRT